MRSLILVAPLLCAAAIAGCANYATIERPWRSGASIGEFETGAEVRLGDRARVTTIEQRVVEGAIVEMDSLAITIGPASTAGEAVVILTQDIARFEVYAPASWQPVRSAALVVAGSLAAYVIVDELTDRTVFAPDYEPVKRGW